MAAVPLWHEKQVPWTWVWSTREAGFHAVVTWQDSQLRVEDRCTACLPVALVPLWQLAHSLTMPVCVNDAGFHVAVPWQAPHSAAVAMCVACLPVAVVPLWQDEHVPITCR